MGTEFKYTIESDSKTFGELTEKLIKLYSSKYSKNVVVPCIDKHPIIKYKGNDATWECLEKLVFKDTKSDTGKWNCVGIIVKDQIVIDIDDKTFIEIFEEQFPFLKETVSETTKNGKHYFFKRTKLLDDLSITTAIKCIEINGIKKDIDIKTISNIESETPTGSVIIVAPSKNKSWVISPFEKDITDIPDELTIWINNHYIRKMKNKKVLKEFENNIIKKTKEITINQNYNNSYKEDVVELLNMVDKKRIVNYNDWLQMAMVFKNIAFKEDKDEYYWEVFDNWCFGTKGYNQENNRKIWQRLEQKSFGFTIGTLKYWANLDSPEKYRNYKKLNLDALLLSSLNKTDLKIADVFYYMYPNKFMALIKENNSNAEWMVFNNHHWHYGGIKELRELIANNLIHEYHNLLRKLIEEKEEDLFESDDLKEINNENILKVNDLIVKLSNVNKQSCIIKALEEKYSVKPNDIFEKFDTENDLMCFTNGVLNIRTKEFRDGKPEDYITLCTDIPYTTVKNEPVYNEVLGFFKSLFEENATEKLNYLLESLAYTLQGYKSRECMFLWIGKSRNGKGAIASILGALLGKYYLEITADNITDKKNKSGQANCDAADMKGKRVVLMSEPKTNEKIQINVLKSWIGGDTLRARSLFKNTFTFTPQFQLILQVNDEPDMSNFEPEFIDKLEMFEFPYRFVKNPDPDPEKKEKLVDRTLKSKFKKDVRYAQQFLILLLEHIKYEDYIIPDFIIERNKKFINNNNILMKFIEEELEPEDPDRKDLTLSCPDMYDLYRKSKYPFKSKTDFYKEMEEKLNIKRIKRSTWYYPFRPKDNSDTHKYNINKDAYQDDECEF